MRTYAQKPKVTQQAKSEKSAKLSRMLSGQSPDVHSILHLQRTIGNQAIQRLLQSRTEDFEESPASNVSTGFAHDFSRIPVHPNAYSSIQPKLKVNSPGDIYEQEADRVAETVTKAENAPLQRQKEEEVQAKGIDTRTSEVTLDTEKRINSAKGSGHKLPDSIRSAINPYFNHDFSNVHIHTDTEANELSKQLNAKAFTTGTDIYFKAGEYQPETGNGKKLISHELTHVVQHSVAPVIQRKEEQATSSTEAESQTGTAEGRATGSLLTEAQAKEWEDWVGKPLQEFAAGFDVFAKSPDWRGMFKILLETSRSSYNFHFKYGPFSGEAKILIRIFREINSGLLSTAMELRDGGLNMDLKLDRLVRLSNKISRGW